MDFLSQQVGPLSVQEWGLAVLGLIALFALLNWVKTAMQAPQDSDNLTPGRCLGCGWEGRVSRYHRTCPKCGNEITRLSRNSG